MEPARTRDKGRMTAVRSCDDPPLLAQPVGSVLRSNSSALTVETEAEDEGDEMAVAVELATDAESVRFGEFSSSTAVGVASAEQDDPFV